jgi:hypothetical protein
MIWAMGADASVLLVAATMWQTTRPTRFADGREAGGSRTLQAQQILPASLIRVVD